MTITTATFHVSALDCPEELLLIEKGLARLRGIAELTPDYLNRRLRVQFDLETLDAGQIAQRLREIGFPGELVSTTDAGGTASEPRAAANRAAPEVTAEAGARHGGAARRIRATTLAGGLLLVAAAIVRFTMGQATFSADALAVAATLVAGLSVVSAAWRAVKLGALDMNALMTLAAGGALATGDYFEAATAMFLFGISLWLEGTSLDRARRAVRGLVEMVPPVAHQLEIHGVRDVPAAGLRPGDRVLVKPGERIPCDGTVERGASSVNQAPITGESLPCDKQQGDAVYAGTLNGEGSLEVTADRTGDESTLAHVARLVEQAQQSRSPTERFVDRFARRYTPAVIALALVVAALPPWLATWGIAWAAAHPAGEWLHRGLVLLVIACPCALVISTPLTIVCGLHAAARRGMLIKGGQFLEQAGRIDCIAFDKTGTLTIGRPDVVAVVPSPGHTEADVLQTAAALEGHSEHPLAQAIVSAARRRGMTWEEPTDFAAVRGFGVEGKWNGATWHVGSPRFFMDRQLADVDAVRAFVRDATAALPATVALVGSSGLLVGAVLLADPPRPDARAAIAALRRLGVRRVALLTGDAEAVAAHVAKAVGIDDWRADLLPEDKVSWVRRLAAEHPRLAMVGDGVNDAPAMAAASIGIALGTQASDAALETADVAVLSPHVYRLVDLVRLGRRTRRLLAENIALALTLKLGVLALAVFGPVELARLWLAVAADVGASLLVIGNGMRLLRERGGWWQSLSDAPAR
ncbi:MAG TPA: cation-translocating P-type ATPase [Pirellulales bacterium]|nr:cation-translocating P-type ATPase [Pirellulales bacterium]